MADDYYPTTDGEAPAEAGAEPGADDADMGKSKTGTMPLDVFPADKQPEPGKVCSFKVVAIRGPEVEMEYAHSEGEETPEEGAAEEAGETPEGAFNERFPMTG